MCKKFVCMFGMGLVLTLFNSVTNSTELITNGNFSNGSTGWTLVSTPSSSVVAGGMSPWPPYVTEYMLNLERGSTGYASGSQTVQVKAGVIYELSFKARDYSAGTGQTFKLKINGTPLSTQVDRTVNYGSEFTWTEWTLITQTFQTVASGQLTIEFYSGPEVSLTDGSVPKETYVDDVSCKLLKDAFMTYMDNQSSIANVKIGYGAVGDGVTNDTNAIQNAINSGKRVYIPTGVYRVTGLNITSDNTSIFGDGMSRSVLKKLGVGGNIINISNSKPELKDLTIDGNSAADYGIYIATDGGVQGRFIRVEVKYVLGTPGYGVTSIENNYSMLFDRCWIYSNKVGVYLTSRFQNTVIDHCLIYSNSEKQVHLGNSIYPTSMITIRGSEIEGGYSQGYGTIDVVNLYVENVSPLIIDGVYFECYDSANSVDIRVVGNSVINVNGMYSNGNGMTNNSIKLDSNVDMTINNSSIGNFLSAGAITGLNLPGRNIAISNSVINGTKYPGDGVKRVSVSTDYVVTTLDSYIGVTNTTSPRTITLPTAIVAGEGFTVIIKDESGGASNSNKITIVVTGGGLIDGVTSKVINTNYGVKSFVSDGSNWFTL